MNDLETLVSGCTVIPVLTIARVEDAVPLARTLVRGGLRVLEVTLRTPAGAAAAAAIRRKVPDAVVALGTVLNEADVALARALGVPFCFSPGLTPSLLQAARDGGLALIPGIQTPSELMLALEFGLSAVKFFPAGQAGPGALRALGGPFPSVRFCPTGGISEDGAGEWLAMPSVFAVGGSWLAPAGDVAQQRWDTIESRAHRAAALAVSARA
ncbi:MAG: bifunctional 4-hydroxy-2-oxoglutarate aldolase/2-dehydro-3-deoxy-phosphogluconate aldolase [Janthinobacterium lividum]